MEVAIRLIAWGWTISSLNLAGRDFGESFKNKLSKSIFEQTEFISNHLSAFSSANNHLIGEAAGLCITGCLFDLGAKSKKMQQTGYEILLEELDNQIFPDGLHKEQTLAYHCFVFDFYLLSFLLLEKNGMKIPDSAWKKLEKMSEVIFMFTDDNLNLPNIGDSDDGYVVDLMNNPEEKYAKSLLNTASILFNRGDFKQKAGNSLDEKTVWLLDKKTCSKYNAVEAAALTKESVFLNHSGYVILKDDNTDAVLDTGQLGYLSIAAHGHADALSLCVNYKGEEFLVDSGTYAYHTEGDLRNYFRGTSAHNTVEVDGQNQSEITGNFMWGKKADVTVDKILLKDEFNYIKARHNGYLKQNINVEHIREVLFQKNKFIIIVDRLYNLDQTTRKHCLNWHLNQDCEVNADNTGILINKKNITARMWNFCNEPSEINILNGQLNPHAGWISPCYGYKSATNTIRLTTQSKEKVIPVTVISFDESISNVKFSKNILDISTLTEKYSYNIRSYLI